MAGKKSFLQRVLSPEYFCPYCSNRVEKYAQNCDICGTVFKGEIAYNQKPKDPTEPYKKYWGSRQPQMKEFTEAKFTAAVKEENISLSNQEFDQLFASFQTKIPVPISPSAFFYGVISAAAHQGVALEKALQYLIPKIPKNVKSHHEIRKAIGDVIGIPDHNPYLMDCCLGCGWLPPYDYPVRIEPFCYKTHSLARETLSSLAYSIWIEERLRNKAFAYTIDSDDLCCFSILPSEKDNVTPSQMESFWSHLQGISELLIFEIVGSGKHQKIIFQFLCHQKDKTQIANELANFCSVNPNGNDPDYLTEQWRDDYEAFGASFGLARHYSYLLRTFTSFEKADPLSSVMLPLSELEKDEGAVIQALVYPVKDEWKRRLVEIEELSKSAKDSWRSLSFKDCPVQQKLKYPLFAVCLRVMAFGKNGNSKLKSFPASVLSTLSSFSLPKSNSLDSKLAERAIISGLTRREERFFSRMIETIPESHKRVKSELNEKELLSIPERNTYRHGLILNTQELASLLHFPSKSLQHPKLLRQETAVAKAPESVTAGVGLLIGINEVFGQSQEVYVPEDFRFRHIYVVGKTGTGKTTLLLNMIKSDVDAGKGVGLIDPHGDLVEKVLSVIPEERIDDVILFDPTDYEYPIGFNMFQVSGHIERRQMRGDIVVAIKRLFESSAWGDNIDQLFRTSVATLLADSGHRHTLLDIRKLISDDVFRSQVLRRIDDEYLQEFWTDDFLSFTRSTISAVKRRLASVLGESEVRGILGQSQTSFNFREMMDTKKIFLANLSRGKLGENISGLFGGLLVSKIQLTAMARASQPEEERVPFYLYVDEFQNFVSESFEIILSEARKYKLCLTIAHQFTGQLPSRLYDAVFGNVGTLIVFEVGVDDATALEKQLGKFSKDDVINLERFHTFTRIGKARDSFSMVTIPPREVETDFSDKVRQASREKYCAMLQSKPGQKVQAAKGEREEQQIEPSQTVDFFESVTEEAESEQQDIKSEETGKLEDTTPEGQTDEIEFFERTTDE